jgi:hypothetical protein
MADDVNLSIGVDTKAAVKSLDDFEKTAVSSSKKMESAFLSVGTAVKAAVAFMAAKGVFNFFEDGIKGAIAEEQAMARLGAQMIATGEDSTEARKSFMELADELENTTKFGDDAVISVAALAKSYGLSNDQAKAATRAAADLASATGDTLEGAMEQLTASFSGNIRQLGKLVPGVKNLTKEQLAAGDAVKIIADRFKGAANAEINTFGGALIMAANSVGDLAKSFGRVITESPSIIAAINTISAAIGKMSSSIDSNKSGIGDSVLSIIKFFAVLSSAVIVYVGDTIEIIGDFVYSLVTGALRISELFSTISAAIYLVTGNTAIDDFVAGIEKAIGKAQKGVETGFTAVKEVIDGAEKGVDDFAQKIFDAGETSKKSGEKTKESFKGAGRAIVKTAEDIAKLHEEGKSFMASLREQSATDSEKIALKAEDLFRKLGDLRKKEALSVSETKAASFMITQTQLQAEMKLYDDQQKKLEERNKKLVEDAEKAAADARSAVERAAADPIKFTIESIKIPPLDLSANEQQIAGLSAGFLAKMLDGAAGAKSLISSGVGAFAEAFIPGIGGVVGSIVSKLAEGPDATKAFIKEFIAAIPDIMTAIAESMPVVVEVFVNTMINGGAQRIAIAMARAMSGEAVLKNLGKQLGIDMGSAFNADVVGRKIADGFMTVGDKLVATFTNIGKMLYDSIFGGIIAGFQSFFTGIAAFFTDMGGFFTGMLDQFIAGLKNLFSVDIAASISSFISSIGSAVSSIGSSITSAFDPIINFLKSFKIEIPGVSGKGGSVGGGIGKAISSVIPKFANGGVVYAASGFAPRGTDTVPAMLSPGEMVLNKRQQGNLFSLANSGGGGDSALLRELIDLLSQPQTTSVTAEVNGRAIADIVLQQSRQRARLSA